MMIFNPKTFGNDEKKNQIEEPPKGFVFGCPKCKNPPQHFETEAALQSHLDSNHCGNPSYNMDDSDFRDGGSTYN